MNAIGIRTHRLDIPTLDFGDLGCENESCSRDRALSNQLCPTGRFLLEVPQWIDFCSRGNLRFLKSYCSLNMYIWHNVFDFFMTQMRISNSISGYPGRQNPKPQKNESCSRDRALSNQPCPTGRLRLEVPQTRSQSCRGNCRVCECHRHTYTQISHPDYGF